VPQLPLEISGTPEGGVIQQLSTHDSGEADDSAGEPIHHDYHPIRVGGARRGSAQYLCDEFEFATHKLVAARLQTQVLDRAIQVFGAMGLTPDTPLAHLWTWGRAMRFLDGPDEVHLRTVARTELAKSKAARGSTAKYYNIG
jgi:alkylation response protein AidB-like acyl-CoA dehydrogenase